MNNAEKIKADIEYIFGELPPSPQVMSINTGSSEPVDLELEPKLRPEPEEPKKVIHRRIILD